MGYKKPTNNEKLEWMKHIFNKIIHITKFEKNAYILQKLKLWMEFLGEFFYGAWYWHTSIKFRTI
jgi:hypothetical protein